MSKIKIKNFGPIKEGYQENEGWLDVKKVTVFIGNQGSGKSTVAKAISTMTWIEKALTRGDLKLEKLMESIPKPRTRVKTPWAYHRLDNYFHENGATEISYQGDSFDISFKNNEWTILEKDNKNYHLPQVMYVPAERNFIAYTLRAIPNVSDSLTEFLTEYNKAKLEIKDKLELPINNTFINYDRLNDKINILGNDYKLQIGEASSGFQSLVPLFIVSKYLAETISDEDKSKSIKMKIEQRQRFTKEINLILESKALTDEQKQIAISELSKKFNKSSFINIVEEPEQNLFPTSQRQMLNSLLAYNNRNMSNRLIMTTHSPYLINYLTLCVKAEIIYKELKEKKYKLSDREFSHINEIVPMSSTVKADELVIYELNEHKGSITKLPDYNGLPSDENKLNYNLEDSNELFAQLLEIHQRI
jgi:predicted ATPase